MANILVTGAAGYIGSHTCLELLNANHFVVGVDNYCNSHPESIRRVEKLSGKTLPCLDVDIRNRESLENVFSQHNFDAVIHFAGLKAVGESQEKPEIYYDNNVTGTLVLCETMEKYNVSAIVFSSSATVYGPNNTSPYQEDMPTSPNNVYGRTKSFVEHILTDLCNKPNTQWSATLLRYFNPIGAHPSGQIGEAPNGIPNNLMPFITQVAIGKHPHLRVFGNDYETHDGTGVRDYIHVVDLAKGHVKAVDHILNSPPKLRAYNLGTGSGYSVLDIVNAFSRKNDTPIPYQVYPRRSGDLASFFANPKLALAELNWKTEKTLDDMVQDSWRWQSNNPNGFE